VIGWDIGGVNTKVAAVSGGRILAVRGRPFELQHAPDALVPLVRDLAAEVHPEPATAAHGVTMTAELSQMFRTKRAGVAFVLEAMKTAFPQAAIHIFTVNGTFVSTDEACRDPLSVAAANWTATAAAVAERHPDALLVDIGTTTTDIIPIVRGIVAAVGRTDPDRLASGELVYTGAVRTPVEAIASVVPFGRGAAAVSAESFALAGDVHVWRGDLTASDYTSPTPDGRPPTREFAGERLARVVCADREMIDDAGISAIADAVAAAQAERVASALRRVTARHPSLTTAVVTGLGGFIAEKAARIAGLDVVRLSAEVGDAAARCAPAASVARLLERTMTAEQGGRAARVHDESSSTQPAAFDAVIKLGGGLLASAGHFERVLQTIEVMARGQRILVVPGGGPFADAVRDADRRFTPGDSAAHWMAILAMDQHAHLIAARLRGGAIVTSAGGAAAAIAAGAIPVLAPYAWLRETDPLPHSWEVTSDSIAAWIADAVGATRLLLIKPPAATGPDLVDQYFTRVMPRHARVDIVRADDFADPVTSRR
jgi:probable H4MPT-linked C1 transfer pathway protein